MKCDAVGEGLASTCTPALRTLLGRNARLVVSIVLLPVSWYRRVITLHMSGADETALSQITADQPASKFVPGRVGCRLPSKESDTLAERAFANESSSPCATVGTIAPVVQ